jgi:4-hydroxy-tetrahydrodipicolinate synthase
VYLYNFPDRTGYGIPVQVTYELLKKHKNIVGYKDTQSGMAHSIELIKTVKKDFPEFEVYAGFDDNFAHNVLSGGNGCIGGLSNVVPEICHSWVDAFLQENLNQVQSVQQKINGLMEIYQVGTPFVPYIKAAIGERGCNVEGNTSFPFVKADAQDREKLRNILVKYEIPEYHAEK